ncbi:lysophospholipid acyltransferase family protein [Nocardia gamkensis]|uniref:1-acyl-sn-glycerol-3-phosphate acyltransferase n=1 Tax=Nocardia gamkensis TaxID=352869 RepID=A0A7X6L5K5_9NOCA|nr:lysophospholipid acyltransferase family protein [Nocardia gamkensis]NKY28231.1 1-acyl-sn-glycerol-3-phosphate acyltransferase [Nocardia gamkensis]NQE70748.1 1-acylglycerol-3-phosphate O-acyltransferase [Nocardia gamkensis]
MAREPVYDILTGMARAIFFAQGLRIDVEGQEHIPRSGGAVLAVNHTAYLDFMEVGLVGRKSGRNVRFMMKAELEHGIVGFLMKHCKAIGVDRTAGAQSYARAVTALREGELVVVYPEATISRSFELKEFKSGAARMALEADVPIVPLIIWGAHRIWTKDIPRQLGRHNFPINIRIGAPIPPDAPREQLTATLRTRMNELLDRAQRDYPMEEGARWVPVRLGGTAPTLAEAAVLEREEMERRHRAKSR